jgi:Flp pilus assembly protein TadD
VSRQSDSVSGRHLLSLSQLQEGHFESAKTTLQPIIESGVTSASVEALLGKIEYSLGNISQSIAHFKKRSELQPESAIAHAQLGMKLLASGDKSGGLS